jgi:hypothetical protein
VQTFISTKVWINLGLGVKHVPKFESMNIINKMNGGLKYVGQYILRRIERLSLKGHGKEKCILWVGGLMLFGDDVKGLGKDVRL